MNWGGISNFVAMGGYALYVWGSYLLTGAVLALEIGLLVARFRRAKSALDRTTRN